LEGAFKGHLVQPPCGEQGHLRLDQVAQSPVQPIRTLCGSLCSSPERAGAAAGVREVAAAGEEDNRSAPSSTVCSKQWWNGNPGQWVSCLWSQSTADGL